MSANPLAVIDNIIDLIERSGLEARRGQLTQARAAVAELVEAAFNAAPYVGDGDVGQAEYDKLRAALAAFEDTP